MRPFYHPQPWRIEIQVLQIRRFSAVAFIQAKSKGEAEQYLSRVTDPLSTSAKLLEDAAEHGEDLGSEVCLKAVGPMEEMTLPMLDEIEDKDQIPYGEQWADLDIETATHEVWAIRALNRAIEKGLLALVECSVCEKEDGETQWYPNFDPERRMCWVECCDHNLVLSKEIPYGSPSLEGRDHEPG